MLAEIWFFVLGVFIIMYVILDGFDLGGAFISPFLSKDDKDRRVILNSIGRVWDGNEVWLIAFGAFLFGVFPLAYARFFSAAYIPVMLLAFVLILRAVAFEFRSQVESKVWKGIWDWVLAISSLLIVIVLSAAGANVMKGVPMTSEPFRLHLFDALNPFALITSITISSLLILHGLLYIANKVENELYFRTVSFSKLFWLISGVLFVVWFSFSLVFERQIFSNFIKYPLFVLVPIITVISFVFERVFIGKGDVKSAFAMSLITVGGIVLSFGLSMYPSLIKSSIDEKFNITVYNASSGELTLTIALVVALIGFVLVGIYQTFVYKTFSGKIKDEDIHY